MSLRSQYTLYFNHILEMFISMKNIKTSSLVHLRVSKICLFQFTATYNLRENKSGYGVEFCSGTRGTVKKIYYVYVKLFI